MQYAHFKCFFLVYFLMDWTAFYLYLNVACLGTIPYCSVNAFVCVSTDSGVFCREEQWSSVMPSCQPGGVWAGLWLDSSCGRQSSVNQTLIVSPPQETIRCLTNHMSVFLRRDEMFHKNISSALFNSDCQSSFTEIKMKIAESIMETLLWWI